MYMLKLWWLRLIRDEVVWYNVLVQQRSNKQVASISVRIIQWERTPSFTEKPVITPLLKLTDT